MLKNIAQVRYLIQENIIEQVFKLFCSIKRITKDIYEAKLKQYDSELNSIEDKLKRVDEVDRDFYVTTEYILQLAQESGVPYWTHSERIL